MAAIAHSPAVHHAIPQRPASSWTAAGRHLHGRRGMCAVFFVAAVGLVFGGAWWGFAAVLPFLCFLPCAAMMAMCMRGHGGAGKNSDAKLAPAPNVAAIGDGGPR